MYAGPFIFYCNLQHWEVAAHPNIGLYVWTSCAGTHQVPPLLCGYPTTAISWPRLPCHGNMAQLCNLPCHHSMAKLCNYPATAVWRGCAMIPPALWPSCARTPPPLYGPAVELLHYRFWPSHVIASPLLYGQPYPATNPAATVWPSCAITAK